MCLNLCTGREFTGLCDVLDIGSRDVCLVLNSLKDDILTVDV